MESSNPLIKAYRKPNTYIMLPSGGKFYDEKPQLSADGELAVYPMTARDELISKTPDALFNGEATVALISSCCPDIPNPRQIPVSDLSVILLGIRVASYGETIDLDARCPSCQEFNQLQINAANILGTVQPLSKVPVVQLENEFRVHVAPFNLTDRTNLQIQQIKQQKMLKQILNEESMSDEDRDTVYGKAFLDIASMTVSVIANTIRRVETPEGDVVEDKQTILEWLNTISKDDYKQLKEKIEDLSGDAFDSTFHAQCQFCNHKWDTQVDLDLANFFEG